MPYYFLCDCLSNTKNTFAKFHETYQTFLKKQRKMLKICHPPQKINPSKLAPSKGQYHQSIVKNVFAYFHKKPNSSQEIEKNTTRQTKTYPTMASRRGLAANFFQCSKNWSNKKNILMSLYVNTTKMSPKIIQNDSAGVFIP